MNVNKINYIFTNFSSIFYKINFFLRATSKGEKECIRDHWSTSCLRTNDTMTLGAVVTEFSRHDRVLCSRRVGVIVISYRHRSIPDREVSRSTRTVFCSFVYFSNFLTNTQVIIIVHSNGFLGKLDFRVRSERFFFHFCGHVLDTLNFVQKFHPIIV